MYCPNLTRLGDHGSFDLLRFDPVDHDPMIWIIYFHDPDQKSASFFLIRIKNQLHFFWSGSKKDNFFFDPDQKFTFFFLIRIKNLWFFFWSGSKKTFFFWSKNETDHFLPKSLKNQMSFGPIDPWSPNRGITTKKKVFFCKKGLPSVGGKKKLTFRSKKRNVTYLL